MLRQMNNYKYINGGFDLMHKAIENPDNICFKCLKEFDTNELHKIEIPALGFGSGFDSFSTKINLCNDCFKETNAEWWKLEIVNFGENNWCEEYKYEDEIFNYIKILPIQGQELFWNRYANDYFSYYMEPQDWIDYELGILPHEKCKKYGLYSCDEIKAYKQRFPKCKHVKIVKYEDDYIISQCPLGATGNENGQANITPSVKCHQCILFKEKCNNITNVINENEFAKYSHKFMRKTLIKLKIITLKQKITKCLQRIISKIKKVI